MKSRNDIAVSKSNTLANLQTIQRQVLTMDTYLRNSRWQVYFSQRYSEKNLSTILMECEIGKYSFNLHQVLLYQHGFLKVYLPFFFLSNRKKTIKTSHMKTKSLNVHQHRLLPLTYFPQAWKSRIFMLIQIFSLLH